MRRLPLLAPLLVLFAWRWVHVPTPPLEPAPKAAPRRVVTSFALTAPPEGQGAAQATQHAVHVERIQEDCGLPLHSSCDSTGCVAVFEAPDLDSPLGWAEMSFTHPWFVFNIVGRDLGWENTPCGAAMTSVFATGVRTWERPGEREVWCAASPLEPEARLDPLCDRVVASALGLEDADFASVTRELVFNR